MSGPVLHSIVTSPSLAIVLALAGLSSLVILLLAVVALHRRRSKSYLLVTLALATLGVRVLLGVLMVGGLIDLSFHHLLEHVVDFLMAVLLLGAIYTARTTDARLSEQQQ